MTLLRVMQVAERLQLSRSGVMALIEAGHLPASNISKGDAPRYRIDPRDIDAYLSARRVRPKQTAGVSDER